MIIVKNRELLIPNNERYIGTTYDTETENRVFQVPRYSQRGVDLAALTFRLDIQYANESYDTIVLDKEVGEAFVILIWRITSATLQVPGTMYIGLRAVDGDATVKWSSFSAAMYVERHLNTPGNYGGGLTEIEQMEQDHQYMLSVVNDLKANLDYAHDAEAWAQGTRNGSAVPSTDKTYQKNSKYYSERAGASATAAANSATAAAGSATQAAETVADTNTRFNNAVAAVTADTEVQDARVGADGTTYTVLKNRLDAENSDLKNQIDATNDAIRYKYNNDDADYEMLSDRWVTGNINSSGVLVDSNTRISTPEYLRFNRDITILNRNTPVKAFLCTYNNDLSLNTRSTKNIETFTIAANTLFKLTVYTDDSTISDIFSIAKNVVVINKDCPVYHSGVGGYFPNLFDNVDIEDKKGYDGQSSSIITANNFTLTGYMPIVPGAKVKVFVDTIDLFSSDEEIYKVGVYDSNKEWLRTISINNQELSSDGWYNFGNGGFIRICARKTNRTFGDIQRTLVVISQDKREMEFQELLLQPETKEYVNLMSYDPSNALFNKGFSGTTNTIVDSTVSNITGYIPIKWTDKIDVLYNVASVISLTNSGVKIVFYTKDKNWLCTLRLDDYATGSYYRTAPIQLYFEGYIRVQYASKNAYKANRIQLSSQYKINSDLIPGLVNPGNTVDVIMFAGQSNMAGRGVTNSAHPETAPSVPDGWAYEYRAISDPTKLYNLIEPFGVAENKSGGIDDGNMKTGSMVAAFAIEYYKGNGNIPMVGISASKGGSGIDDWQIDAATGYLADAIERYQNCIDYLDTAGISIRHKYLVWCQGEHDYQTYSTYEARWQAMYDEFKDIGVEKCLLVRIGNTNSGDGHFTNIIATETEMAQKNTDIVMVSTTLAGMSDRGLMKDELHYLQEGYNECGRYAGVNAAIFATQGKEPTMFDPEINDLYYSHKN